MEPVERHGAKPQVIAYKSQKELQKAALPTAEENLARGKGKLGIICKCFSQAETLYRYLKENLTAKEQIHIFSLYSRSYSYGCCMHSGYRESFLW